MRVGKARALKIGHRIGLAPDDIVENPKSGILKHSAAAEDIVIATNHPECAVGFQDTPRLLHPAPRESVVDCIAVKLVPIIINRIDAAAFGAIQIATKLKIIRRVSKNHIDAGVGERSHRRDAIIHQNLVKRERCCAG